MLGGSTETMTRAAALAALEWWRDAGVDVLVEETPRDWLATPAASPTPFILSEVEGRSFDFAQDERVKMPRELPAPKNDGQLADTLARTDTLDALRLAVETLRPRAIFADGDPASGVMIVGETAAPDDDRTGKPFSGPAGGLLDRMLAAIGLDRTSTYITNLLLWRSFGKASAEDSATGAAILRRHIELAKPRLLLLMGGAATQALLDTRAPITALRGSWIDLTVGSHTVAALPTFNPAYLLRNETMKRHAWTDLKTFKARLDA